MASPDDSTPPNFLDVFEYFDSEADCAELTQLSSKERDVSQVLTTDERATKTRIINTLRDKCVFSLDKWGYPDPETLMVKILTESDQVVENYFGPSHWTGVPRPAGFVGPVWRPTRIEDLTTADWTEFCGGCRFRQQCDCNFDSLKANHNLLERDVGVLPAGDEVAVYANATFAPDEFIALDPGILRPITDNFDGGRASFQEGFKDRKRYTTKFRISNPTNPADFRKAYCYHDTFDHFGIPHFIRHSCRPNTVIVQCRYGGVRVRFLRATRLIQQGEELTHNWARYIASDVLNQPQCVTCPSNRRCPTLPP
ncbi:hypothetical protein BU26DRAFT_507717 [Trematosphaeria pertusa]|uniref:SET domain-containing protein n=1 Tax=Trematosphaeria pertusa TaxID=390896 RepID=A0A6A6I6U1_9PLEO|nr:uncharacterized protein BU26DRAFT_507717 [Trematosphaeria pertusa]KAF2246081.1 hypothetical protein BU26DRAFT_507717 [Trematosphaeria pertusa]